MARVAHKIPSIAKTPSQRQMLGQLIRDLVMAGLQQKGQIEDWWARCEQYHRNDMASEEEDDNLVPVQIPFSQPRQDMLTAQVCSTLTRPNPYMLADTAGNDSVETKLETALHRFWKSSGFETVIRRASSICTDTNRVWWRVAWEHNPSRVYGGVIIDVFHPKHVCIFPATQEGIPGARLVGHRFFRRLRQVEALQRAGAYFNDTPIAAGDSPRSTDTTGEIDNAGAAPDAMGPDPRDLRVELWDVLVKCTPVDGSGEDAGPEQWYRATIAYNQAVLLSIEEYPYSRPWYFDSSYIIGNDDAYWPGVSVARHLSLLQDAANKMHTGLYNGTMAAAYPPVFGPQLPEKDMRYGWGDYVPADSPANSFFAPTSRFDPRGFIEAMQAYDMSGDKTARVSSNTMGTIQSRETSATENSIIAAGVSVGLEEYIGNFSASFGDMAGFTQELLRLHYPEWSGLYAKGLNLTQDELHVPALWEPNGKSSGNTPGARLAAIDRVVGLAKAFGPASGLDPYEIVRMAIPNLGLEGAENLQRKKEEMLADAQAQAQSEPNPGSIPTPGMGGPSALPPGSPVNGGDSMPPIGPGGQFDGNSPEAGGVPAL